MVNELVMNIGIVTTWFERGAAYVSRAYMQILASRHKVFIYARGGEATGVGEHDWDLPCVTWAPSFGPRKKGGGYYLALNHFCGWLSKEKIDIVFFNEERNHEVVLAAKNLGYTIGAYVDYYTPATVPFFNIYDFLVCNTKRHFSVFKGHPKCLYIPWGTDTKLFRVKRKGRSNKIKFFHNSGMDHVRKGTDSVVRAFRLLKGDVRLIIHSQKPLKKTDFADMELSDSRIEVINQTVKAPGLYHLGDVYVYPSQLEGIGLTICEALSCGLPVITTDNPPMNEFVINGQNGLLVKVAREIRRYDNYYWPMVEVDIDDLACKMQWYVDHPEEVERHSLLARKSAEEFFCWRKNARVLYDFIDSIEVSDVKLKPPILNKVVWRAHSLVRRVIWNIVRSNRLRKIYKSGRRYTDWLRKLYSFCCEKP